MSDKLDEILEGQRSFKIQETVYSFLDDNWIVYRVCEGSSGSYYDIDLVNRAAVDWPTYEAGINLARGLSVEYIAPIIAIFEPDNLPGYWAILIQNPDDHYYWSRLLNEPLEEDEVLTIGGSIASALDDLYRRKIAYRNILLTNVYVSNTNRVTLTGFQNAVRFEGDPPAEWLQDDVLAFGEYLSAITVPQRSEGFVELIHGMTNADPLERLTFQQVVDHPLLQHGIVAVVMKKAALFESVTELR
jgi:serine/threonine protein kinase